MADGRVSGSILPIISRGQRSDSIQYYLVVDQAPLLEKGVDSHYSANISSKIAPASGDCEIFRWVETVGVDHEVAIVFVDGWCLASIATIEELWEAFLLCIVDGVHIEPGAVAR